MSDRFLGLPVSQLVAELALSRAAIHYHQYQLEGAAFMLSRTCGILGDDRGLGKTREAALAISYGMWDPVLVVCPSGLRLHWERELGLVAPQAAVCRPTGVDELRSCLASVTIIPYSRLGEWYRVLAEHRFIAVLFDEGHYLRNSVRRCNEHSRAVKATLALGSARGVHRSDVALALAQNIERVWVLTGTPQLARNRELFNLLRITRHPLGDRWWSFTERFCGGRRTVQGIESHGSTNSEELAGCLEGHMLRRRKEDVITLPGSRTHKVLVRLEGRERALYREAWAQYLAAIRRRCSRFRRRRMVGAKGLTQLTLLRAIASRAKVEHVIRMACENEGKAIFFSGFNETLGLVCRRLTERGKLFVRYDGALSEIARDMAWQQFQHDPEVGFFVGNVGSAKEGLTLTAARSVFFLDLCWTPGDHDQATDRAVRLGQTAIVDVYYVIARGTVDEPHLRLLEERRKMLVRFFSAGSATEGDSDEKSVETELIDCLSRL